MFKGGIKEAAKMLQLLGPSEAKRLLAQIAVQDPKMAQTLADNLISMEDLQHLTVTMLVDLLKDIDRKEFGQALRTVEPQIVNKLLSMVSSSIKLDIEEGLKGPPIKVSDIETAQEKILKVLKEKIDKGQIVIDASGDQFV